MSWGQRVGIAGLATFAPLLAWGLSSSAQQQPGRPPAAGTARPAAEASRGPQVTAERFEFEVIQSFDARYLGDTPGHLGKNGGLENTRPNVALGDPVYRAETHVGTVTHLTWDRGRGSLEVEFDPEPGQRVRVGDIVWLSLAGRSSPEGSR